MPKNYKRLSQIGFFKAGQAMLTHREEIDKIHGRDAIRKFLAERIEEHLPESSLDKVFEAAGYTPAYVALRQLGEAAGNNRRIIVGELVALNHDLGRPVSKELAALFERCFGKPYVAPPAKPTPVAAVPKPCTLPVVTKGA